MPNSCCEWVLPKQASLAISTFNKLKVSKLPLFPGCLLQLWALICHSSMNKNGNLYVEWSHDMCFMDCFDHSLMGVLNLSTLMIMTH
jgi:hypothetical protein